MLSANYKKVTQVVNFLAAKYKTGVPKLKLIKLVWAADRYHLRKYSRTVTGDDYLAMKNGPVASCVKDVVEFSINEFSNLKEEDLPYIKEFIVNENGIISSIAKPDIKYLSKTDLEALNFAFKTYGKLQEYKLIEETHKYPEWEKQSKKLEPPVGNGTDKSSDIDEIDFYKNPTQIEKDPFALDPETLKQSKKIFLEFA